MKGKAVIVLVEDDAGHARLIERNLKRSGVDNRLIKFNNGQKALDFFFRRGDGPHRERNTSYILLLDLKMPKISGVDVLQELKSDKELRRIPVIVITTTDDPREVELCHFLGCSGYITKPVDYEGFENVIGHLGQYLKVVQIPQINGHN